jgi:hypothetical protein
MTWTLRPYQREAIDATYQYWEDEGGNPLAVLPTGPARAASPARSRASFATITAECGSST